MGRLKKRTYHLFLAFKLLLILAILFLSLTIFKGNPSKVKEQNFISPLTIPMQLSGSFGELRGNHFHSGIDLRTQERTGFPVIAIGDGYVARIKVSSYGFGKVLYLAHPNGYTSVYAHLSRFSHEIHQYILKEQYKTSSFSIERFPGSAQFVFKQGDTIGFTGNTGGTTGPHLHFEIRNSGQLPMNPASFHLPLKDTLPPVIDEIVIFAMDDRSRIYCDDGMGDSARKLIVPVVQKKGIYTVDLKLPIELHGNIAFGIRCHDKLESDTDNVGVSEIYCWVDGNPIYGFNIAKFGFHETRYVNAHIDYAEKQKTGNSYHRCFKLPGNSFSAYTVNHSGISSFSDGKEHLIRFKVKDAFGQESELQLNIKSLKNCNPYFKTENYAAVVPHQQSRNFTTNDVMIHFPADIFYDTMYFEYRVKNLVTREGGDIFVNPMIKENMSVEMLGLVYSRLHYIHNSYEPVHKRFTISIKPKRLPKRFRSKALIGYVSEDGIIGKGGSWSEGYVTYRPRTLGPFLVIIDTVAPGIKPINVEPNADLSNSEEIRIKVSDPISGIKSYKGTIDGKWILLEYDYKEDLLVYTFDERINKGSHILELVVIDEKNNKSKLSLPFTR